MSAECSRCRQVNPEAARFCSRCHTPLRFTCPACGHVQDHAGACDACGVDFLKHGLVQFGRMQAEAARERDRDRRRHELLRQLALVPLTGGLSLLKYLRNRGRDR
jgi:double zinc ribbon protein